MFSIHGKLFLALKQAGIIKITPPQVPFTRSKYPPPPSKISHSLTGGIPPAFTAIWKTLVSANNFRTYKSLLAYYCMDISWVQDQLTIHKSSWRTRVYFKWYCARPEVHALAWRIREALNRCWDFQWIIESPVSKQCYYWSHLKTK